MTRREMLARMGCDEYAYWLAMAELDPFGGDRGDFQAAIVAATVANSNPYRDKNARPISPADFLPAWVPKPPESVQAKANRIKGRMRDWAFTQEMMMKQERERQEQIERTAQTLEG
jgi:hypothetical protein